MTTSTALAQERIVTQRRGAAAYLPLAIRTADLPCLVVGGGRIGTRKAVTLASARANVTVLTGRAEPHRRLAVDVTTIVQGAEPAAKTPSAKTPCVLARVAHGQQGRSDEDS